jgi:FO synthase subunit 1
MGLMLETTAAELEAHRPFTTGLLIGIGEKPQDRIRSLQAIKSLHGKYGHIQEVIIQPFIPKPFTPMWNESPPSFAELKEVVRAAREILPEEVSIQVPPNLTAPKVLIEGRPEENGCPKF